MSKFRAKRSTGLDTVNLKIIIENADFSKIGLVNNFETGSATWLKICIYFKGVSRKTLYKNHAIQWTGLDTVNERILIWNAEFSKIGIVNYLEPVGLLNLDFAHRM